MKKPKLTPAVKSAMKNFGSTAKLVGYKLPKEIAKRAVSHSYTANKIFNGKIKMK